MKRWFQIKNYKGWIDFDNKYIWSCGCEYGSLWRGSRTIPCRHVREELSKMKLTDKEKEVLKKIVSNQCEICHKKMLPHELIIHRISRGCQGGEYIPRNIMIVCLTCHKTLHSKEFK
jgi:hypothetical protein